MLTNLSLVIPPTFRLLARLLERQTETSLSKGFITINPVQLGDARLFIS